jgi:hypothetical protein
MLPKWVASLGRHDGRIVQAEPSQAPGRGPVGAIWPTGEGPGRRISLTILRDRLSTIEGTLGPRGDAFDSFQRALSWTR